MYQQPSRWDIGEEMSAFIVGREHIWAIVESWAGVVATYGRSRPDWDVLAETGQMLWDECKRSVKYRYSERDDGLLPGPIGCDFKYGTHEIDMDKPNYTVPQILKACHCLEYQSCEHPGWEDSNAKKFLDELCSSLSRRVDGYEEADWEIADIEKAAGPCTHKIRLISKGMACVECGDTSE